MFNDNIKRYLKKIDTVKEMSHEDLIKGHEANCARLGLDPQHSNVYSDPEYYREVKINVYREMIEDEIRRLMSEEEV